MPNAGITPETVEDRADRYSRAAALLRRRWLAESDQDDAGAYDWPAIDRELENIVLRCRDTSPDDTGVQ